MTFAFISPEYYVDLIPTVPRVPYGFDRAIFQAAMCVLENGVNLIVNPTGVAEFRVQPKSGEGKQIHMAMHDWLRRRDSIESTAVMQAFPAPNIKSHLQQTYTVYGNGVVPLSFFVGAFCRSDYGNFVPGQVLESVSGGRHPFTYSPEGSEAYLTKERGLPLRKPVHIGDLLRTRAYLERLDIGRYAAFLPEKIVTELNKAVKFEGMPIYY